jgi:probable rRNA maturation factor
MFKFHNTEILHNISHDIDVDIINHLFDENFPNEKDVNIVFVKQKQIKELNKEYRNKDEVTDVLSFNIDSDTTLGEIYLCPEYVINNIGGKKFKEEILRLLIHGFLHLKGFEHKTKFDEFEYKSEPMYIKQEEILNKFLSQLIQKWF